MTRIKNNFKIAIKGKPGLILNVSDKQKEAEIKENEKIRKFMQRRKNDN